MVTRSASRGSHEPVGQEQAFFLKQFRTFQICPKDVAHGWLQHALNLQRWRCAMTRFLADQEEGHVMTWDSDRKWVLIYSILVTLLMFSWVYVPA
jgi:hypothetical protein